MALIVWLSSEVAEGSALTDRLVKSFYACTVYDGLDIYEASVQARLNNPLPTVYFLMLWSSVEFFFSKYHQGVKQLGSRSGPTFCRACSGFKQVCKGYQQTTLVAKEFEAGPDAMLRK